MPDPRPTSPYNYTGTYCGPRQYLVPFECDASGNAAVSFPAIYGYVHGVAIIQSTFANTADITLKFPDGTSFGYTGLTILGVSNVSTDAFYFPRMAAHKTDGTASGTYDKFYVNGEELEVTVAQGGNGGIGLIAISITDN